jgi:hypothetical protein
MALEDVEIKGSPGWWMKRLSRQQTDRYRDLEKLTKRYDSDPPLPEGAEKAKEAYRSFQKLARTNYEELICRAVLDRQTPVGFRTAAAGDEGGDAAAAALWRANLMAMQAPEILEHKLARREGYILVAPPDRHSDGQAVITAEDPRNCITANDPVRPWIVRAGLKTYWDPDEERDYAYVYLPGENAGDQATVHKAYRAGKSTSLVAGRAFSPKAWTWDDKVTKLPTSRAPIVRVPNRGGMAEFEKHVDLIDRIRHGILQRMVLVVMQAFRQRALKGMPSHYPDDWPNKALAGKPIDYSGLEDTFASDPAAIWLLPPMAELWESAPAELTGVLAAGKDDTRELSTVSQSPFYMFVPDGANQTAAGATLQREGINFKVKDHNTRDGIAFALAVSLGFEMMGGAENLKRSKFGEIETLWAPVEQYSLAEKADASSKAKGLSPRRILTDIWQLTPAEADAELKAQQADAFLQLAQAGMNRQQAPGQPGAPQRVASTRADQAASDGVKPALTAGRAPANDAAATA